MIYRRLFDFDFAAVIVPKKSLEPRYPNLIPYPHARTPHH